MKLLKLIGTAIKFFARARAGAHTRTMILTICVVFPAIFSSAQDPQFIRGQDSEIHGIVLDHSLEATTRQNMQITEACPNIRNRAKAMGLVGSEGASVNPRINSSRGLVVLEGLKAGQEPKILDTELLAPYQNLPLSIPAETNVFPASRYPLAMTIAATLAGEGDLVLQKGDYLIVHADGQLYAYYLPDLTIPSEGVLRLFLGTDDTLYYDEALRHPIHSGACGGKQK
jgi:hypothetical protein